MKGKNIVKFLRLKKRITSKRARAIKLDTRPVLSKSEMNFTF